MRTWQNTKTQHIREPRGQPFPSRWSQEVARNTGKTVRLFVWFFESQSTIFQLCRDGSSWIEQLLSDDKCFLLKDTMQCAGKAQTRNPSVSSQALYHWVTAIHTDKTALEKQTRNINNKKDPQKSTALVWSEKNTGGLNMSNGTNFVLSNIVDLRRKDAKIRNHYTKYHIWPMTSYGEVTKHKKNSTKETHEVRYFPTGDHKTTRNRHGNMTKPKTNKK